MHGRIDTNSKFKAKFSDNCLTGFPNISTVKMVTNSSKSYYEKRFKDSGVGPG